MVILVLIALLLILLFSISCKSKQEPETEKHSRAELVGTWKWLKSYNSYFDITDNGGNFRFPAGDKDYNTKQYYYYTGKIPDTFDSYPYSVNATCIDNDGKIHTATITFYSPTNGSNFYEIYYDNRNYNGGGYVGWQYSKWDTYKK